MSSFHTLFGQLKDDYFNFSLIERFFKNKSHAHTDTIISDKTCEDLDITELFMYIDRTCSKVGQQYLYNTLRTIPDNFEHVGLHEKIIAAMQQERFRAPIEKQLRKLSKNEVYYITSLFQDRHVEKPQWFFWVPLLSFSSIATILLIPFFHGLILLLIGLFMINLTIHYWNKRNLNQYLGSLPQLVRLKNVAVQLYKIPELSALNTELPAAIRVIDKIKARMAFFQLESNLQGDFEALFWSLLELFKISFLLEPLLLFNILKRLDTKRMEMEAVYSFVGATDALLSIASLRQGLTTYCQPEISEETHLQAVAACHPLIPDCIPNDIHVSNKSVLLTGSNMSGKSSFIRTIGINVITGLTINTCFAQSWTMSRLNIHSAIRISDDLLNDKSYYFEEVLSIREMMKESTKATTNLFLLDEIFKGTNTIERIAAGKAVLSALSQNNNIVFVSTHDIELTDMLADEYDLYHFSEVVNDHNVDFDYKLKTGQLKKRNAIRILEVNDYPANVIREAIEIAGKLDAGKNNSNTVK